MQLLTPSQTLAPWVIQAEGKGDIKVIKALHGVIKQRRKNQLGDELWLVTVHLLLLGGSRLAGPLQSP
jgi:hypothetical protein